MLTPHSCLLQLPLGGLGLLDPPEHLNRAQSMAGILLLGFCEP